MAYLLGLLMTLYPYARAAMSLTSQIARDRFAALAGRGALNIPALVAGPVSFGAKIRSGIEQRVRRGSPHRGCLPDVSLPRVPFGSP